MTLELKRYKDDFFNNSTEPYALGGVTDIGLMPKHEEYFLKTLRLPAKQSKESGGAIYGKVQIPGRCEH